MGQIELNQKYKQEIISIAHKYIEMYETKSMNEGVYDDELGEIVYLLQKAMGVADDDDIILDESENIDCWFGVWEDLLSEYLDCYAKKEVYNLLHKMIDEFSKP